MKFTDAMRHELHEGFCKAANPRVYIDEQAAKYKCDRQVIREAIGLRTPDPTRVALPDGEWNNDSLFPGGESSAGEPPLTRLRRERFAPEPLCRGATSPRAAGSHPSRGAKDEGSQSGKKKVGHPKIDPSIREAAVKAMRGGMTLREASERFKVTKATLQLWRGAAGMVKPYGKRAKKH